MDFPFHEAGAPAFPGGVAARLRQIRAAMNPPPSETPRDLASLTRAICHGDEAAFARFYDLYSLRLYKHLLILARGNEDHAREVLQTVLLKLSKRFQVFEQEPQLWAWLRRVARNAFIDHCRARSRAPDFVSIDSLQSHPASPLPPEDSLASSLRHVLDALPPADRELMRAVYIDGQPLQSIADESGQTYKAIESRLSRLRGKLKCDILNHLRHEQRS